MQVRHHEYYEYLRIRAGFQGRIAPNHHRSPGSPSPHTSCADNPLEGDLHFGATGSQKDCQGNVQDRPETVRQNSSWSVYPPKNDQQKGIEP